MTLDLSSSSAEPRDRERSPIRVNAVAARASSAGPRMLQDDVSSVSTYTPRRRSRALHSGATRDRDAALHTGATHHGALASPIPPLPTFQQSASQSNMQSNEFQQINAYQQNVLNMHQQQNNVVVGVDPSAVANLAAEAAGAVNAARAEAAGAVNTVRAEAAGAVHAARAEAEAALQAARAEAQSIANAAVLTAEHRAEAAAHEASQAVQHAQAQASTATAQSAALQLQADQANANLGKVLQLVNELERKCKRYEEENFRLTASHAANQRISPGSAIPSLNGDGSEHLQVGSAPASPDLPREPPSGNDLPGPQFSCAECGLLIQLAGHVHQCPCGRVVHYNCLCRHGSGADHLTTPSPQPPPPPPSPPKSTSCCIIM